MSTAVDEPTPVARRAAERQGLLYVVMAVFFFSTSPVLVRWAAEGLGVYEIAAGRLLLAGALVLSVARLRGEALPPLSALPQFLLFGLVTAIHFIFYIASLEFTTIAHSLAIIYTAPIFAALLSRWFLREEISARRWSGIGFAVVGVALLAGFEPAFSPTMFVGDALALVSAAAYAVYSLLGRSQRDRYPLLAYAGSVYLLAGLWLLPAAGLTFSARGYTLPALLSVAALGILPLAIGHTLYNAALRRTSITVANVVATQEVTIGILLGALLLGEVPSLNVLVGVAVTLLGILLVIWRR